MEGVQSNPNPNLLGDENDHHGQANHVSARHGMILQVATPYIFHYHSQKQLWREKHGKLMGIGVSPTRLRRGNALVILRNDFFH